MPKQLCVAILPMLSFFVAEFSGCPIFCYPFFRLPFFPFSVFVISDNNIVLPFFPTISVLSFRCRIFSLPNFPLPIFLVAVFPLPFFPLPLFHTLILCCPVFLPYHFSLPIFPIAKPFFGCRFFRCRFSVAIFPLPFLPFTDATAAGSL